MEKRILVVPDVYYDQGSGAKACRKLCEYLQKISTEVAVFVNRTPATGSVIDPQIRTYDRTPFSGKDHIFTSNASDEFKKVILEFAPTHVFFLGQAYNKPIAFYKICDDYCIKRIHFFWQQDFYCQNGYACLKDGPCRKCLLDKDFLPFGLDCMHGKNSLKDKIRVLYSHRAIQKYQNYFRSAYKVMGTGTYQLQEYELMGVKRENIIECPLFFDHNLIETINLSKGNYFVCYGQNRYEKGWNHLLKLLDYVDNRVKIVFPFSSKITEEKIAELGLTKYIQKGVLEIKTGITWNTGVRELVAGALGIVLPSVWPTTTEYTFLESIGYGKPVFVWNVGVNKEYIQNGFNGFAAEIGDITSMAESMYRLVEEVGLYEEVSKNSRLFFERITDDRLYLDALYKAIN